MMSAESIDPSTHPSTQLDKTTIRSSPPPQPTPIDPRPRLHHSLHRNSHRIHLGPTIGRPRSLGILRAGLTALRRRWRRTSRPTCTPMRSPPSPPVHACMRACVPAWLRGCVCSYVYAYGCICARVRMHTRALTAHTQACTHARTHARTHLERAERKQVGPHGARVTLGVLLQWLECAPCERAGGRACTCACVRAGGLAGVCARAWLAHLNLARK